MMAELVQHSTQKRLEGHYLVALGGAHPDLDDGVTAIRGQGIATVQLLGLIGGAARQHDYADTTDLEAVGHQVATLQAAVEAATFGGTVFYFGVPDDESYPISMRTMLRNNLTLKSGITMDRRRVLAGADDFARAHPDLLPRYITHTFGADDVQAAFELACRPVPERVKIVITR